MIIQSGEGRRRRSLQKCQDPIDCFINADRFHTTKINRTFAQKAWAAFDLMPHNNMPIAKRSSKARLGRTKDSNRRDTEQRSKMHRAGVIRQDRKSTRLNSSHRCISYAVFCLKKKKKKQ